MSTWTDLRTLRLRLRKPNAADLHAVFAVHGDPQTNTFNPDGPLGDLAGAARLLDRWRADWSERGIGYWAVELAAGPAEVVGFGGLRWKTWQNREVLNLYFRLRPQVWGQGLAVELGRTAVDTAFRQLDVEEIVGATRHDNRPSIATLKRIGLQPDGTQMDDSGSSLLFRIRREA
ncbi:GNAT family N-acetyltransferase [Phenylobacterium sp.]|jgi:RimJ/RimL family protein N-acetyltransferase|uniref:GNAT family N-acetyltransferase n=1 Tax=Phenylobacterium sp. TaxID=1871053 RepID=UPI002E2EA45C|nr:GNAT family N-acetyltransferase [Phenylobacterium sp.]HEX3363664.1 GNAT family N-acetyltransferase [Phenylobacterium sp.]